MVAIEGEIENAILAHKRWADLDIKTRDIIGSSQEYDKKILKYSIQNQLRYRGNLVRFVINSEHEYYRDLLKYSKDHLMIYPYHLSDFIITAMRITPFQYYLSLMTVIIEQDKSYDILPNFTAADCLISLNIGRNQYIDIMNEARAYRGFLGLNHRKNAKSLLPTKPNENIAIEPWWFINAGYITEDDVRSMVTPPEKHIIDRLISPDGMFNQIQASKFDEANVRSLYLKGLIYLDVPIYDEDIIIIPPLEGFVMNRVTGDYLENLLYKVFVTVDQKTTVKELANILGIDIKLIKNAISIYCRLVFAYKKNIHIDPLECHPSWLVTLNRYRRKGVNVIQEQLNRGDIPASVVTPDKKIAFFYDSTLAAVLMMGNLSDKLKRIAVTMFEVGKLSDEWIDNLLMELSEIRSEGEYEARRFYIQALHQTIDYLRNLGIQSGDDRTERNGLDLVRLESLSCLDNDSYQRYLVKNYKLMISMAPLNYDVNMRGFIDIPHMGPGSPLVNSIWFRLYLYHLTGFGVPSLLLVQGYRLRELPPELTRYGTLLIHYWDREPTCIGLNNAITTINDALTLSPILIQAYPIPPLRGNLINGEEKCFVPIPLIAESKIQNTNEVDLDQLNLEERPPCFENCQAVKKLLEFDHVSQLFGYVTLIKTGKWIDDLLENDQLARRRTSSLIDRPETVEKDKAADDGSPPSVDDLLLYDINFGIPLFDEKLNEQIRNRLDKDCLTNSKTLANLVKATKQLSEDVFRFVESFTALARSKNCDMNEASDQRHFFRFPDTDQFRCNITRPSQNLIYQQGKLTVFSDVATATN